MGKVFRYLDSERFDEAKTVFATRIVGEIPRGRLEGRWAPSPLESGDFFGSEEPYANVFSQFLNFEESWGCPDVNCNRVKKQNVIAGDFVFDNAASLAYIINKGETRNCNGRIGDFQCNSEKISVEFNFPHNDPLPLIIFTLHINVADGRTSEVISLE